MSHLKILIELDYSEAVQMSRLISGFIRAKVRHEKCRLCGADLLTHPHDYDCPVAVTQRVLDQMDPPPKPTLWQLVGMAIRKVAA